MEDERVLAPRRAARWFYREHRDEGVWLLFSLGDSDQIEGAWRRQRTNLLLPGPVARKVCVAARTVEDVESGVKTSLVRGTWYFSRSDRLLQPYPEAVAERLADSVRHALASRVLRDEWSFDAGNQRVIHMAEGGGFVEILESQCHGDLTHTVLGHLLLRILC
jgi:hypothetical protein